MQDYYTVLKNTLLSYKGVKARMSWNFESFNKARLQLAKLNVKGRTLELYINLNPEEYNVNKYHFVNVSDKPKFADVPMLIKVRSDRALKYAIELIAEMMEKNGIIQGDIPTEDYHMPYETNQELAKRDLVKVIVSKGVKVDKDTEMVPVDVNELLREEKPAEETPAEQPAPVEEPVEEVVEEPAPVEEPVAEEVVEEPAPVEEPVAEEVVEEPAPVEEPVAEKVVEEKRIDVSEVDSMISDEDAIATIEMATRTEKKGTKSVAINTDTICENFEVGEVVNLAALKAKRLVAPNAGELKILARGSMTKPLDVYADRFSVQAIKLITLAGGKAFQYK